MHCFVKTLSISNRFISHAFSMRDKLDHFSGQHKRDKHTHEANDEVIRKIKQHIEFF